MEEKKIVKLLEDIRSRIGLLEDIQSRLGLLEDIQSRVISLEGGQKKIEERLKNVENKLDATFEMTGKNFEEISSIKAQLEALPTIKEDIRLIKHKLKTKADVEEIEALENRITIVERRLLKLTHK